RPGRGSEATKAFRKRSPSTAGRGTSSVRTNPGRFDVLSFTAFAGNGESPPAPTGVSNFPDDHLCAPQPACFDDRVAGVRAGSRFVRRSVLPNALAEPQHARRLGHPGDDKTDREYYHCPDLAHHSGVDRLEELGPRRRSDCANRIATAGSVYSVFL